VIVVTVNGSHFVPVGPYESCVISDWSTESGPIDCSL